MNSEGGAGGSLLPPTCHLAGELPNIKDIRISGYQDRIKDIRGLSAE